MAASLTELAATVRIRAHSTRELFHTLGQRSFPMVYLDEVAAFPRHLVHEILAELPALETPAADDVTQATKYRQLKRYGLLLEHVHQVSEFLESSDVLSTPQSVSQYLHEVVASLLNDGRLVLRADTDFNYSFEPLARTINEAVDATGLAARLPEPLALFKFPSGPGTMPSSMPS